MAGDPIDLWNEWATQILVLWSLTLQFVLLFLAGIRRREAPAVLRFILWVAYQLADSTAIYAVGHLSLSSTRQEHKLVAFWAPFLLLHLGGPDNITAYALQDNQLWTRHLTTLVVQVLGAAYVIYRKFRGSETSLLLPATILVFAVGFIKYGERTWALRCGNFDSIRTSIKKEPRTMCHFYLEDAPQRPHGGGGGWFNKMVTEAKEEEFLVRRAHSLFHICKCAIADSSVDTDSYSLDAKILRGLKGDQQWIAVMEMELSLMYDILYTKAAIIHSELGYLVRAFSPVAIAASFLLFQLTDKDGQRGFDVVVSYILLGGAIFMETTSLLGALGSSWTLPFLCNTRWSWLRHAALCSRRWERLRGAVVSLRCLAAMVIRICSCWRVGRRRLSRNRGSWPGTLGQYNMLHLCIRRHSTSRRPLLGSLAKWMGFTELWERKHYSGKIMIPEKVNESVIVHIIELFKEEDLNTLGVIRNSWGERTLERWNLDGSRLHWMLGVELQEGIIIWHIGTDIFLAGSRARDEDVVQHVKAIEAMSNYMMFLLVRRTDMLPGLAQNRLYQQTCRNLEQIWSESDAGSGTGSTALDSSLGELFHLHDDPNTSRRRKDRRKLGKILLHQDITVGPEFPRLSYAIGVARVLLKAEEDGKADPYKVLLDLWTDILVYAANRSSRESHAKKLNNGGELTTFLWLMTEHFYQISLYRHQLRQLSNDSTGKP